MPKKRKEKKTVHDVRHEYKGHKERVDGRSRLKKTEKKRGFQRIR